MNVSEQRRLNLKCDAAFANEKITTAITINVWNGLKMATGPVLRNLELNVPHGLSINFIISLTRLLFLFVNNLNYLTP